MDVRIGGLTSDEAPVVADLFARSRAAAMPWLPVLHTPDEDRAFFARLLTSGGGVGAWGRGAREQEAGGPGVLLGFAIHRPGWLDHLYVEPEESGRGIGTLLLETVMTEQAGPISLWAFQRNSPARAFYGRRGFVEVEWTDGEGNEERLPDVRMHWEPGLGPSQP